MSGLTKESILVRRNGMLGLGNAGWEEFPSDRQVQVAVSKISHKYGHSSEKWAIIDAGYRESEEFTETIPTKYGSIPLPWTPESETWKCIKTTLTLQAGCEMDREVDALLDGFLPPVLLYEDYGLVDGEKQLLIAHALAIPVRTFILKKVK